MAEDYIEGYTLCPLCNAKIQLPAGAYDPWSEYAEYRDTPDWGEMPLMYLDEWGCTDEDDYPSLIGPALERHYREAHVDQEL